MYWMKNLDGSRHLYEIVMPGSHDAALYNITKTSFFTEPGAVKTQELTVAKQLDAGCRFFDFRVYSRHGQLWLGHFAEVFGPGHGDFGGLGPSLSTVLNDVRTFLEREDNEETVIIRFSHVSDEQTERVVDEIVANIPSSLRYKPTTDEPLALVTLRELRGKVVMAFAENFAPFYSNEEGILPFYEYGHGHCGLITCGHHPKTRRYSKMKRDQEIQKEHHSHHRDNREHFFVLHWTMTGGNVKNTSEPAIKGLYGDLCHNMLEKAEFAMKTDDPMPNIVLMDFVDAAHCAPIIEMNF